jgi:hypothetical protein
MNEYLIFPFRFLCVKTMATCVVQPSSSKLPPIAYPRELLHAITHDSIMTSMSCRKRLLSEQNDCTTYIMKYPDDEYEVNKRIKTGNCIIFMPTVRTKGKVDDSFFDYILVRSSILYRLHFFHTSYYTFFFPTNRFICP